MVGENWGATAAERTRPLDCDDLLPSESLRVHRAISIGAPPWIVFDWLCQLRLAPYSYDLLDNFGRRSPRELTPGLNELAVGQRFMKLFELASFVRNQHVTLRRRGVAVTYAVSALDRDWTRLLVRVVFRANRGRAFAPLVLHGLAVGDLVMMRKQLLTLKALVERDAARRAVHPIR
ncbi:MAG: hypothetical protein ABR571_13765 [Jatrophihabitans sp.]|uniref:hypothetical protein n=1 Tax=Jatrophihabitans sp. TaxID=1932789 RepID=UPI00390E359D